MINPLLANRPTIKSHCRRQPPGGAATFEEKGKDTNRDCHTFRFYTSCALSMHMKVLGDGVLVTERKEGQNRYTTPSKT